jgi:tripartite-type tricarboxylate transporter receptor subunit TctC
MLDVRTLIATLVAVLVLAGLLADAGKAEEFFGKKTITLIAGGNPGGGYDLYARALARHYSRHIPGEPTIIVQNMPGAGSVNLANHLYNRAVRDGTVIGMIFPGVVVGPLLDDKDRGALPTDRVCLSRKCQCQHPRLCDLRDIPDQDL